jgi:hypothetical protein
MDPIGLIFIAAGAFTMAAAIRDWDWFMGAAKARFMITILTRKGARIFYAVLGFALVVVGALGTMRIVDMSN